MTRNQRMLFHQLLSALLIAALLIPNMMMTGGATAFASGDRELLKAISELRAAVASLPARLFASAVKRNLESEIAELKEVVERGEHCRAAKIVEDFLGGIPKLREGERTPYAEDLFNRAWSLRRDAISLIPKGDPCATTPRFNQAPGVSILESDNKRLRVAVGFGEPSRLSVRAGNEIFTQLDIPGLQSGVGEYGLPAVPVFHRMLALPQGAKATLNFKPGKISSHKLNLYPIQPEAADTARDKDPAFPKFENPPFVINKAAYAKNSDFPATPCTITPAGRIRELELIQISCAAGQYNPVSNELKLFESIEFEVLFQGGRGAFVSQASANPFENNAGYYPAVLNIEAVGKYTIPDLRKYFCPGEEYLILTHPDFRSAADRLAVWKNTKGIVTNVINVNDGGGPGPDTREKIDELIESRYNRCLTRPSYILLLGDAEFIPTFYFDTFGSDKTGSDYPYALLGDDDQMPDFALGRIPVDTLSQADIVVDKIVNYEMHPPAQNDFYKNVGVASQFQCCRADVAQEGRDQRAFIETTELVRDHLLGEGYGANRIYTTTVDNAYNGDPTPRRFSDGTLLPQELRESSGFTWSGDTDDIIDEWNAGRFLFYHRDHGWKYGWGHPDFHMDNVINDLSNGNLLPVVFSVNCASGLFDNETADGDYGTDENETYFAEELLRKSNGGAVGVLGDTRNSPTGPNNILTKGFFDAVWPDLLPAFGDNVSKRRLGDILNHGKLFLISHYGLPAVTADLDAAGISAAAASELYLWHVLGDPTLEMWTSKPRLRLIKDFTAHFNPNYLLIKYQIEQAMITAYQETRDGIVPLARGRVTRGEAVLPFLLRPTPGAPIHLAVSTENDISRKLTK
ncbi:MAG: C25 family cysteine peptidase [Blastocatellia bacterium]